MIIVGFLILFVLMVLLLAALKSFTSDHTKKRIDFSLHTDNHS